MTFHGNTIKATCNGCGRRVSQTNTSKHQASCKGMPTVGKGRQPCKKCKERSIAGMAKGEGLCPYHWAEHAWGKAWADKCYPDRGKKDE